ncbi:MAG: RNA 2',3'-cyclic phosphodiesterase [Caldilineaceae bacterium]
MRTFIAIEFPPTIQQQLADAARQLRAHLRAHNAPDCLRWAGLHNAHLTLRFLGDTTDAQAQALAVALEAIAQKQPPFELALDSVGGFPHLRQPRVLWLGVAGDMTQLCALQSAVEQCVQRAGLAAETQPFSPHVTLARADRQATKSDLRRIGELVGVYAAAARGEPLRFAVNAFVHMESRLQRGGAVHTPLRHFRLGG